MKQHFIGKHLIHWFQWYITCLSTPINEKNMADNIIWLVIHYTQYHAKKIFFFFAFLRMWEYQVFISINSWSRICNFYACTPKMNNDTLIFWTIILHSTPSRAQIAGQVWGTDDKILYFSTNLFLVWLKFGSFVVFQIAVFRPLPVQPTAVYRIINVARVSRWRNHQW